MAIISMVGVAYRTLLAILLMIFRSPTVPDGDGDDVSKWNVAESFDQLPFTVQCKQRYR
jgi:hypothetical protein